MGYTIYVKSKIKISKNEAVKIVEMIKELVNQNKDIIDFEFKDDKYNIAFNGLEDEAHETFTFYTDFADSNQEKIVNALNETENTDTSGEFKNGWLDFNFCKTARKPYDKFVKMALMKIQEITGNKLDVSCDDGLHYFSDKIIEYDVAMEINGSCQLDQNGEQMYENKTYKTLEETNEDGRYDW